MPEHRIGPGTYLVVFIVLEILTATTALVARVDLGPLNTVAALTIATIKMLIVMLFFMHLKYSSKLTSLAVALGFVWLIILLALAMSDYTTRAWNAYPRM